MRCYNCFSWQKFDDNPRAGVCRIDNTVRLSDEGCERLDKFPKEMDNVLRASRNYYPMAKLRRETDECQVCGRHDLPLEVHHILPLSKGGEDKPTNLAVLCKRCHAISHLWMEIENKELSVSDVVPHD